MNEVNADDDVIEDDIDIEEAQLAANEDAINEVTQTVNQVIRRNSLKRQSTK